MRCSTPKYTNDSTLIRRLCRFGRQRLSALPIAAERFDQKNRDKQPLPVELARLALGAQERLLGGEDVEEGRYTAFVAIGRELEHAVRAGDRDERLCMRAFQIDDTAQAVFYLLHRVQHDAAVVRDRELVAR